MATFTSDIAFSPRVKAEQTLRGSRDGYAQMEQRGGWQSEINDTLRDFLARQRSAFLATVNSDGQPSIQHRGGPPGFLRPLDARTIGFADFSGNRQYISIGNLSENPKAHLFLIDYEARRRIKIWGRARSIEGDAALMERLVTPGYRGRPERAILLETDAWDTNCPQHIPQRFEAEDVEAALAGRDQRIAALEAEIAALRAQQA